MFNPDDIVKHKASFLRSVGWYTDVPRDGKVIGPGSLSNTVMVHWCDRAEPVMINVNNIMLAKAWDPN